MRSECCPVCGTLSPHHCSLWSRDYLYGIPGTFEIAVCEECGSGWTLPPVSAAGLGSFYPASYQLHLLEHGLLGRIQSIGQRLILKRALVRPPLQRLSDLPPGDLLDVGCGRADVGAELVRRGWRVSGIDPSAQACEIARTRGVQAHVGTLETVQLQEASFDAVVMGFSLEHVPDPLADLERIHHVLRPGGLLLVTVPNFASWQRHRFGPAWFQLDLPRHRTHFVPKALQLVLARAGFDVLSLHAANDFGSHSLMVSLQYRFAGRMVLKSGPAIWSGYIIGGLASPFARVLDRVGDGGGPCPSRRRPAFDGLVEPRSVLPTVPVLGSLAQSRIAVTAKSILRT